MSILKQLELLKKVSQAIHNIITVKFFLRIRFSANFHVVETEKEIPKTMYSKLRVSRIPLRLAYQSDLGDNPT